MSSNAPGLYSSPALVFSLSQRLQIPPTAAFDALLLLNDYLGPIGNGSLTPTSAKHLKTPLALSGAASVLAASKCSPEAVLEAIKSLLGPKHADKITLEALQQTAGAILEDNKHRTVPNSLKTPAHYIEILHATLRDQGFDTQYLVLETAFKLLEIVCLSNNGAQCGSVLRRGGALLAGACLAASFAAHAPAAVSVNSGPVLMGHLADLTGFPVQIILGQVETLLQKALEHGN